MSKKSSRKVPVSTTVMVPEVPVVETVVETVVEPVPDSGDLLSVNSRRAPTRDSVFDLFDELIKYVFAISLL